VRCGCGTGLNARTKVSICTIGLTVRLNGSRYITSGLNASRVDHCMKNKCSTSGHHYLRCERECCKANASARVRLLRWIYLCIMHGVMSNLRQVILCSSAGVLNPRLPDQTYDVSLLTAMRTFCIISFRQCASIFLYFLALYFRPSTRCPPAGHQGGLSPAPSPQCCRAWRSYF